MLRGPYIALFVAVLAISTAAPLVALADPAPPLTVAFARVGLAGLLFALARPRELVAIAALPARELARIALAGALLAAHFGAWITSLTLTSTASSVALVATQPVFAALLGAIFLRDAVGRREWLGIAIAGAGCALIAAGDWGRDTAARGDLLALAGASAVAAYLVIGRSLRASIPLLPYLAMVHLIAGALLAVAVLATGADVAGFSADIYAAMAAAAIIPSIIGHSLLNAAVRRAPAHLVTLAILGEPIGASLLAFAILGEVPPATAAAGGAVIVVGIAVGFARRRG
jgi:drug/metabolite transporter (DMT)-like permease